MGIFRNDEDRPENGPANPNARVVPLLPLRDIVVFPHMVVPLFVGRAKSIQALEDAMGRDRELLLCAQREAGEDEPSEEDIYPVGTLGSIIQLLRLPDGTVKVLVEGKGRVKIRRFVSDDPFFACELEEVEEAEDPSVEVEALVRTVHSAFEGFVKLNKKVPPEVLTNVGQLTTASRLADTISTHLNLKLEDRQKLLELIDSGKRLEEVFGFMQASFLRTAHAPRVPNSGADREALTSAQSSCIARRSDPLGEIPHPRAPRSGARRTRASGCGRIRCC